MHSRKAKRWSVINGRSTTGRAGLLRTGLHPGSDSNRSPSYYWIASNNLLVAIIHPTRSQTKKRGQAWAIRSSATSAADFTFFCRFSCIGSPRRAALLGSDRARALYSVEVLSIGAQPPPTLLSYTQRLGQKTMGT